MNLFKKDKTVDPEGKDNDGDCLAVGQAIPGAVKNGERAKGVDKQSVH